MNPRAPWRPRGPIQWIITIAALAIVNALRVAELLARRRRRP